MFEMEKHVKPAVILGKIVFDNDVIENIVLSFKEKNVDAVFGDLVFVNNEKDNQYSRFWKSSPYKLGSFLKGWVPHTQLFMSN